MKAHRRKRAAVPSRLRILVVDDHEMVRQGLRSLLEEQSGWNICGEAATGAEAIEKARQLQPDVVVMDVYMPRTNSLLTTREILAALPHAEVLILTVDESPEMIRAAFDSGALGFVSKADAGRQLVAAVSALAEHKPFCSPRASAAVAPIDVRALGTTTSPAAPNAELTGRERDILALAAQGRTHKEIGEALKISDKTVETHRRHIMRKLGLRSPAQLVRYAVRNGLVRP